MAVVGKVFNQLRIDWGYLAGAVSGDYGDSTSTPKAIRNNSGGSMSILNMVLDYDALSLSDNFTPPAKNFIGHMNTRQGAQNVQNTTLTDIVPIGWTISSISFNISMANKIMIAASAYTGQYIVGYVPGYFPVANEDLGTVSISCLIDGVQFTSLIYNLYADPDFLPSITGSFINNVGSGGVVLNNPQYSKDGGISWAAFGATITVPANSTMKFRGTFTHSGSTFDAYRIITPWGTTEVDASSTQTVTTPAYNVGTSPFTITYQSYPAS